MPQVKKAPRVLFDDIETDINTKVHFLNRQKVLLAEILKDYGVIGAKINILRETQKILDL